MEKILPVIHSKCIKEAEIKNTFDTPQPMNLMEKKTMSWVQFVW